MVGGQIEANASHFRAAVACDAARALEGACMAVKWVFIPEAPKVPGTKYPSGHVGSPKPSSMAGITNLVLRLGTFNSFAMAVAPGRQRSWQLRRRVATLGIGPHAYLQCRLD